MCLANEVEILIDGHKINHHRNSLHPFPTICQKEEWRSEKQLLLIKHAFEEFLIGPGKILMVIKH